MKCDVFRIVTRGGTKGAYRHSANQRKAEWINSEVQGLLSVPLSGRWHDLITGPFRHKPPVQKLYAKRFLPEGWHKNAFYASLKAMTSVYEVAYHFLNERIDKPISNQGQDRILFSVDFSDSNIVNLCRHPNIKAIMDRNDISSSHAIVMKSPETDSFLYPSCRAPDHGECVVTYNIECLGYSPKTEQILSYSFDARSNSCTVTSPVVPIAGSPLVIKWLEVSES